MISVEDFINKPFTGDWFKFAKIIPDNFVQLTVTSPPYWRMRNYNVPPTVWQDDPDCDHVWGEERKGKPAGRGDTADPTTTNFGGWKGWDGSQSTSAGQFCDKGCGAWLGCLGLEETPEHYTMNLADACDEVYRVTREDAALALIIADCYASGSVQNKASPKYNPVEWKDAQPVRKLAAGLKSGDLVGIPFMVAFELRRRGWYWRQDIVWAKPNPMAEPVRNRCVRSHEFIMVFVKSGSSQYWTHRREGKGTRVKPAPEYIWRDRLKGLELDEEPVEGWRKLKIVNPDKSFGAEKEIKRYSRLNLWQGNNYFWDGEIIREPTRDKLKRIIGWHNKYDVWHVSVSSEKDAHYAPFPMDLIKPLIMAGSSTWGCCPECRAPYYRLVDKSEEDLEWQKACGAKKDGTYEPKYGGKGYAALKKRILRTLKKRKTVGWYPTCDCKTEEKIKPCLVLDPFGGTFTTGLACRSLGRDWLSSDINGDFVDIGERRIAKQFDPDQVREEKGVLWS